MRGRANHDRRARTPRGPAGVLGRAEREAGCAPPAALARRPTRVPRAARVRPNNRRLGFRPMRILVTGGAGFIGSHCAKRLAAAGDEVVVLDKLTYSGNRANLEGADVEFVQGDVADRSAVTAAAEGCEAIVNFAAETHVDRSILGAAEFIETDVLGTYVLIAWAREAGARLVQVSTDEVYGDVAAPHRCGEDDPLRPSSPYSASKAGGDLQVLAAVRTYGGNAS